VEVVVAEYRVGSAGGGGPRGGRGSVLLGLRFRRGREHQGRLRNRDVCGFIVSFVGSGRWGVLRFIALVSLV